MTLVTLTPAFVFFCYTPYLRLGFIRLVYRIIRFGKVFIIMICYIIMIYYIIVFIV